MAPPEAYITVRDLTMAYGSAVIQRDLTFTVRRGDIFIIMGGSGSGKSTLLWHLIGLLPPAHGEVLIGGENLWAAAPEDQERIKRRFGVLFQNGGLWSSMTLAENVALPLETYTELSPSQTRKVVSLKLALVGLAGFEAFYPSELSGGMQKRAGLARAMALDPDLLFFDEPSAGLDPISAQRLDELILELRESLGATVVVVTHDLASIFTIGNDSIFLDAETKTIIARGDPKVLRETCPDPKVRAFLTRGGRCGGEITGQPGARPHPGERRDIMRKRANPAVIGGFVVSAVALIVIGVLVFGGGRFLTEQRTYVLYFEDSVEGLSVGAPVTQQGVRIGSVSDIQVQYLRWKGEFRIPVFIDIEPGRVKDVGVGDSPSRGGSLHQVPDRAWPESPVASRQSGDRPAVRATRLPSRHPRAAGRRRG